MKHIQKYWIWYVAAIILLLVIFRKNIFGNGNGAATGTGRSGRRSLSRGENMAINKFKRDLAGIGIYSESDVTASNQADVQRFVTTLNQSFRNIGSDAKAEYTYGATARKRCADIAFNRDCTGYSGFIVCITWGCI